MAYDEGAKIEGYRPQFAQQQFAAQAQSQAGVLMPKMPSLNDNLERHIGRLSELAAQLENVADTLHGPVPSEVQGDDASTKPMRNMAARMRDLGDMIGRCQNATSRIMSGL